MTDTSVKVFKSTDSGAGGVAGQAGSLIAMILDKCLVNGYGEVILDSLVVAGNVATGIKNAHGFTASGSVGPVIRIAGVTTPAGINGDYRITITSPTTFTFATTGIADQTATGTITAKRAPAGFSKEWSGVNKAVYRADNINSTRLRLRVDDSPTQFPTLIMYETMSDVDTGVNPCPTSASFWAAKSNATSSAERPWRVVADTKAIYVFIDTSNNGNWDGSFFFGDILPYKVGDGYHCALIGHATAATNNSVLFGLNSTGGAVLARSYTQNPGAVTCQRRSHYTSGGSLCSAGNPYPNPVDNRFHAWPIECWEPSGVSRGLLPGGWNPIHSSASIADGTIIDNVLPLNRAILVQRLATSYAIALDIVGPWS